MLGYTYIGGVGPVSRAKGIIEINRAVAGQLPGELRIILIFLLMKPQIFQEMDLTRFQTQGSIQSITGNAVMGKFNGHFQKPGQCFPYGH